MRQIKTEDISQYMNTISGIQTLTRDEEIQLAEDMKSDNELRRNTARERLICSNLRLVVKIAHEFKGRGVGFADLVEEGNLGLMTAIDKYDADKDVKISCYAAWWIKEAMHRAVHKQAKLIRMPTSAAQKLSKIIKARRRYMQEFGVEPSLEELASMTGIPGDIISKLDRHDVSIVSMDNTIAENTETTFEAVLSDQEDDSDAKNKVNKELDAAVSRLCDLDRLIITRLFGFGEDQSELSDIAQETGMPVTMLKEHLTGILASMKRTLTDSGLPSLLPSF